MRGHVLFDTQMITQARSVLYAYTHVRTWSDQKMLELLGIVSIFKILLVHNQDFLMKTQLWLNSKNKNKRKETPDAANAAFFLGIFVAVKTLLTYPVSACATEHSFSSMKRLKTYDTMKHDDRRSPFIVSNTVHPNGKIYQCWECALLVFTAQ